MRRNAGTEPHRRRGHGLWTSPRSVGWDGEALSVASTGLRGAAIVWAGSARARMNVERLADLDFEALTRGGFHPSPSAWEDEVLYFLLLDRFSDGREDGYR